jgi:hypothetical protein
MVDQAVTRTENFSVEVIWKSDDNAISTNRERRPLGSAEQVDELSRARNDLNTEARLTRKELHDDLKRMREEFHGEMSKNCREINDAVSMKLEEESSRFTHKDWVKIILMPLLLAVIAAVLATILQDRSFKKNTLFTTQYERILSAQKEAITQSQDLNIVLNLLKRSEELAAADSRYCSAENFSPLLEQLKQLTFVAGLKRLFKRIRTQCWMWH